MPPRVRTTSICSLEWYYADSSYLAAGLFEKRVSNFIGTQVTTETLFGIRDQTSGPRAQAARAALLAGNANNGFQAYGTDDTNLFVMTAMMRTPPRPVVLPPSTERKRSIWRLQRHTTCVSQADDPLYQMNVSRPVNSKDAKIWGAEFAAQHFFGQTGFGLQANYTLVKGDVKFDNGAGRDTSQFALLGLQRLRQRRGDVREIRLHGATRVELARRVSAPTPTSAAATARSTSSRTTRSI